MTDLNQQVKDYREKEPCGTGNEVVKDADKFSAPYFESVESIGTKAYSSSELLDMFSSFDQVELTPFITVGDTHKPPASRIPWIPNKLGWFYAIRARRSVE